MYPNYTILHSESQENLHSEFPTHSAYHYSHLEDNTFKETKTQVVHYSNMPIIGPRKALKVIQTVEKPVEKPEVVNLNKCLSKFSLNVPSAGPKTLEVPDPSFISTRSNTNSTFNKSVRRRFRSADDSVLYNTHRKRSFFVKVCMSCFGSYSQHDYYSSQSSSEESDGGSDPSLEDEVVNDPGSNINEGDEIDLEDDDSGSGSGDEEAEEIEADQAEQHEEDMEHELLLLQEYADLMEEEEDEQKGLSNNLEEGMIDGIYEAEKDLKFGDVMAMEMDVVDRDICLEDDIEDNENLEMDLYANQDFKENEVIEELMHLGDDPLNLDGLDEDVVDLDEEGGNDGDDLNDGDEISFSKSGCSISGSHSCSLEASLQSEDPEDSDELQQEISSYGMDDLNGSLEDTDEIRYQIIDKEYNLIEEMEMADCDEQESQEKQQEECCHHNLIKEFDNSFEDLADEVDLEIIEDDE